MEYEDHTAQLDSLVEAKPKTRNELLKISGFGEKKIEKYGDAIISIINAEE
ncbi:HRDC domain-containing protein [Clostridium magnum]|uniref:HRDC domain-containing protein n=1 Tax=Clostridium magnum TaxID=33954 RepID=UPI000ACD3763|nr:HRDC domain-containing protein [Clostridium magnum]